MSLLMLDLFCGLGGASAAMRARGWEVVGVDVEQRLQPEIFADLATWRWEGRRPDLIWASPPCVEFSDARCMRGQVIAQPSAAMVAAALRIVMEVRPRFWLVENVRGARPWFAPVLGPPVLQSPPLYLWGRPPPGLLLPSQGPGHKEHQTTRSADPRVAELGWRRRRAQLRAVVPYQISYAVADAVERAS